MTESGNKKHRIHKRDKSRIDFRYNLGIYLRLVARYKAMVFGLLILLFILSLDKVVDKYLFKIAVDRGSDFIVGTLPLEGYRHILLILAAIFIALMLIKVLCHWYKVHLINVLESNLILDVKKRFFNHILGLSYGFHTSHRTGAMISKLVRTGSAVERMTDAFAFNFIPLFFHLLVVAVSIYFFDPISAIIVALTAIAFVAYGLWLNHIQQSANIYANEVEDYEKASISDFLMNIESIKLFGKEGNIKNRYARICEETKKATLSYWNYYRWFDSGQSIILNVGTLLLLLFPLLRLFRNQISIGDIVFIYSSYLSLVAPLFGFLHGVRGYYRSMADFESLFKYGKIENEIKDRQGAKDLRIRHGAIEFRHISFWYGKKRPIFEDFSLKISKNKKLALVGPSGSGKSTLVKLLYRLYDTDDGSILIDGEDIKDFRQESLRSELSIVPQECLLFDDTIYNNIRFSNPQASRSQVMDAIAAAQLMNIVNQFPAKENTIVGERGIKLSGGEKQRVSIARAILADKKVLVLDEATSSLDSDTEAQIQKALEKLMQGRTSIIIAHRLSTIMNADMIIVMDKGSVVQTGTHEQLIRKKGLYGKLWNLQKGGYIQ